MAEGGGDGDLLLLKIIIIGDTNTGKSCLLHQFIENYWNRDTSHTVGVEFGSKVVNVSGRRIKLQVWDTAGQERFRSVTRSYYRGAAGCLLVFDIASRESFDHAAAWLRDVRQLATPDVSTVLVGNKSDLRDSRQVSVLEASRFAQENQLVFLEASAATGEGVEECFLKVARATLSKLVHVGGLDFLGDARAAEQPWGRRDDGGWLSRLRPRRSCCL